MKVTMSKVCSIFVTFLLISVLAALDSEECKIKPKDKHCLIEWAVRDRWPHQVRYVYDWATRKCFEIRWSKHCPVVPSPPITNNFYSQIDCILQCSGVFKRFREVNPDLVPKRMTESQAHTIAVPVEEIEKLPELKENPFKRRICQVFSHDGSGNLTFEDFLDMMSVFSEAAPRDIKAWYAFRIYDLDDDMFIGREDLLEATRLLTKGELHPQERDEIVASVLDEADVDGDGRLSFMDFEHVVVRAPDFLSTFHIRV